MRLSLLRLAFRSLIHYRKAHLSVIIGTAISTMVITGTLLIGDSVKSSLEKTVHLRLGRIAYLFSGTDRYVQAGLAEKICSDLDLAGCPLMQIQGIASSGGGKLKVNAVNVNGISEDFRKILPENSKLQVPGDNESLISENLASRLNLQIGDFFLLQAEKISLVPRNAPFVSDEDNRMSLRLKVTGILGDASMGRFNLKASQTAPGNVFLSLPFLNRELGTTGKANRLLFTDKQGMDAEKILSAAAKHWTLEDMSLRLVSGTSGAELRSDRIFIDPPMVNAVEKIYPDPVKVLTYFVNAFIHGSRQTPYSFISAGSFRYQNTAPGPGEMFINSWLASDLSARTGDSIKIRYFVVGPLRNLVEKEAWFRVSKIVLMEGVFADRELMPDIPGLSDAGNCSDWQAGVPIDLRLIRDKDEAYWDEWRGTPKAFISYEEGRNLWSNRFGSVTMLGLPDTKDLAGKLADLAGPGDFGFSVTPVKKEGLESARGGVDFSELFMGLSFFLLIGGLTLLALLYGFHLEKRMGEAGTLKSLGFTNASVRKLLMYEGLMIAIPGVLAGGILAVLYNKLIFAALNTVWSDIVRTSVLSEKIEFSTLLAGMGAGLVIAWLTIFLNIYFLMGRKPVDIQKRRSGSGKTKVYGLWIRAVAIPSLAAAFVLLGFQIFSGGSLQPAIFFVSGGLLLLSLLLLSALFLMKYNKSSSIIRGLSLSALAYNDLKRKPSRSIRIIILFAVGTFIIISTGLNQKDLQSGAASRSSGTGGFLFYGETTLPLLTDLNKDAREYAGGSDRLPAFLQMRQKEGDDASCLNLNRISQPRILGFPAEKLEGRFTFVKMTNDLDKAHPWISLKGSLPGGVIPAVADQTVIQWGLGKKIGDTLTYRDELGQTMKLKLVGGLANSIFQGNVLIDESHFLQHFPSSSGTHVMLVDGNPAEAEDLAAALSRDLRNSGLDLERTANRLARFNEIENTYLSIFLLLGGLGMILGTVGLGISLARNLVDRRKELGLLKAVGFSNKTTLFMVAREHMALLLAGTAIGTISAFLAIYPSLVSDFVEASWQTAVIILFLILINGAFWILLVTRNFLKKSLIESLRDE